jgi:hypothetical protein
LEAESVTDDGNRRLGEEAQNIDDDLRGVVSNLTEFDVRKHKRSPLKSTNWLILAMVFAIAFLVLIIGFGLRLFEPLYDRWSDPGGAVTGSPADLVSTASSLAPDIASSDAEGPLSGTWAMYWTNVNGSENQAFTIRFDGDDRGTIEIFNDDTEFDTHFRFDGDLVWFTFTRVFEIEISDSQTVNWPEISTFEGTFTGADEISGEWAREGWDCVPDRDPPCQYRPDAVGDPSRLVRQ